MPRYNKSRYHDPVPGIDYQLDEPQFYRGKDLARLVKWNDDCGWVHGIVEAQKTSLLRIYVFNKDTYGKRRAVKRREDVLFT
tara:strand:+ start:665 stop:910 length:246 start_codon:yes stop_codon:yes gene_type:complete